MEPQKAHPLKQAMAAYFERFVADHREEQGTLPWACVQEDVDPRFYKGIREEGWACWLPIEKTAYTDLAPFEQRLGVVLHPDIKAYFNSFWFADLFGPVGDSCIELDAVLPGIETRHFMQKFSGDHANNQTNRWIALGLDSMQSLSVVIDNESGGVFIDDFEVQQYIPIAANLAEMIQSWT